MGGLDITAIDVLMAFMGYLLGSIPFGLILTRAFADINIRHVGSGNIGATNVLRTGRKGLAILTLITDGMKGAVAIWIAFSAFEYEMSGLVGFAAVCGHCFPIWLKGRGGKGVATGMASLAAIFWPAGVICAASWLLLAGLSRISSLAALGSFCISILTVWTLFFEDIAIFNALWITLLSAIIFLRHHSNIKRLLSGEEPRISFKRS